MKAISPISGKEGYLRTEEWAYENRYLLHSLNEYEQMAASDHIVDFNEWVWEMEIDGKFYIIKRA